MILVFVIKMAVCGIVRQIMGHSGTVFNVIVCKMWFGH